MLEQLIQKQILDYLRFRSIPCYKHQNAGIQNPTWSGSQAFGECLSRDVLHDQEIDFEDRMDIGHSKGLSGEPELPGL